ncbi:MAG: hypothetical protein ACE5I1_07635 [bacterium]
MYEYGKLQISPNLQKSFLDTCRQRHLDPNRVLEEMVGFFVSKPPQQSLEDWARELLGDISLSDDDEFVDGLTVREYFSFSEEDRDKLWEKWEQEAEEATKNVTARKAALDAHTNR